MIRRNTHRVAGILTAPLSGLLAIGLAAATAAAALGQSGTFANTGSMNTARGQHAATLLESGEALVSGGDSSTGALTSAELYNPSSGKWTVTGSMNDSRVDHTSTLLQNGQVLVAGGASHTSSCQTSAELYNSSTGAWTVTGSMNYSRSFFTATLLNNGKVLVAGGEGCLPGGTTTNSSAELYDPSTGTWTVTGSMTTPRQFHTATLLQDGEVLVAGGNDDGSGPTQVASAELYNPTTGTWTATGSMHKNRANHTATLLTSGQVLVVGGRTGDAYDGDISITGTAELYNPATGEWSVTDGTARNSSATATLLENGNVLVAGGEESLTGGVTTNSSAELYDPSTGTWTATGSMSTPRTFHTATLLQNGQVLIAGGYDYSSQGTIILASAELFTP
jgi:N-acetylneuraminic acid mutarotase